MAAAMHRARAFARSAADMAASHLCFSPLSAPSRILTCVFIVDPHQRSLPSHGRELTWSPHTGHLHDHARDAGPMVRRLAGGRISAPGLVQTCFPIVYQVCSPPAVLSALHALAHCL